MNGSAIFDFLDVLLESWALRSPNVGEAVDEASQSSSARYHDRRASLRPVRSFGRVEAAELLARQAIGLDGSVLEVVPDQKRTNLAGVAALIDREAAHKDLVVTSNLGVRLINTLHLGDIEPDRLDGR